jgi:Family of unknown function (DUF6235)
MPRSGQLRLDAGDGRLATWAEGARQADRNAMYEVLFAVAGSALLRSYEVHHGGLSIAIRPGLVVRLSFPAPGRFSVLDIGEGAAVEPDTAEAP